MGKENENNKALFIEKLENVAFLNKNPTQNSTQQEIMKDIDLSSKTSTKTHKPASNLIDLDYIKNAMLFRIAFL